MICPPCVPATVDASMSRPAGPENDSVDVPPGALAPELRPVFGAAKPREGQH